MIEGYDNEINAIRLDVAKMCWSMRGGLTYDEGMSLSYNERKIIGDVIKDNLDTTKKTGLPYF